jgi:predicted amidohydrolase
MRVACCQLDIAWEDKRENYRRVERLVRDAKLEPGTLLLLPEMFATGFSMNAPALAEKPDGATAQFVAEIAREFRLNVMAGVILDDQGDQPRNEALLIDPTGTTCGRYAKVHRFGLGGEDRNYAAGEVPVTCAIGDCTMQPAICYDLRFPELFRHPSVLGRAELICVIANWPVARVEHWTALLKARAIENQAFVAGCNRTGADPSLKYPGRSQIVAPWGDVIVDAGADEKVVSADLDLPRLREYRAKLPFLREARL